jgi:hypothetical protein
MKIFKISVSFILTMFTSFTWLSRVISLECSSQICILPRFKQLSENKLTCQEKPSRFDALVLIQSNRLTLQYNVSLNITNCQFSKLILSNFDGFHLNTNLFDFDWIKSIEIYNSVFEFFTSTFATAVGTSDRMFRLAHVLTWSFKADTVYRSVPVYIFQHAYIRRLAFYNLIDNSMVKNVLSFLNEPLSYNENLNITILSLDLYGYGLEIDNTILNENVFRNLTELSLNYHIENIYIYSFQPFTQLKALHLNIFSMKALVEKGFMWLRFLNSNQNNYNKTFHVYFNELTVENQKVQKYSYPDEDFCQFKDFNYTKNVYIEPENCSGSCLFAFLTRNNNSTCSNVSQDIDINDCNFELILTYCDLNETEFSFHGRENNIFIINTDPSYSTKFYDFLLSVVMFPFLCLMGFLFNLVNIFVLKNKRFEGILKERSYRLMYAYSLISLMVCFVYTFELTIKCIDPIESYCFVLIISNAIYRSIMLTTTSYFGNLLRTGGKVFSVLFIVDCYNFSTGATNSSLNKISKLRLSQLATISFMFSSFISIIHLFEYDYNLSYFKMVFPLFSLYYFDFNYPFAFLNILFIFVEKFLIIYIQIYVFFSLIVFIWNSRNKRFNRFKNKFEIIEKKYKAQNLNIQKFTLAFILFQLVIYLPDLICSIYFSFKMAKPAVAYSQVNIMKSELDPFLELIKDIIRIIFFFGYTLNFFVFYFFSATFRESFKDLSSLNQQN